MRIKTFLPNTGSERVLYPGQTPENLREVFPTLVIGHLIDELEDLVFTGEVDKIRHVLPTLASLLAVRIAKMEYFAALHVSWYQADASLDVVIACYKLVMHLLRVLKYDKSTSRSE